MELYDHILLCVRCACCLRTPMEERKGAVFEQWQTDLDVAAKQPPPPDGERRCEFCTVKLAPERATSDLDD